MNFNYNGIVSARVERGVPYFHDRVQYHFMVLAGEKQALYYQIYVDHKLYATRDIDNHYDLFITEFEEHDYGLVELIFVDVDHNEIHRVNFDLITKIDDLVYE